MGHEAVTCAVSREPSLQYLPSSDGLFRLANIYVKPSLIFLARRGEPSMDSTRLHRCYRSALNSIGLQRALRHRGWVVVITCPMTSLAWCILRDVFNWTSHLISWLDFMRSWINVSRQTTHPSNIYVPVCRSLAWAIWTKRNKMVIEKVFPSKPSDVTFLDSSFSVEVVYPDQTKGQGRIWQDHGDHLWLDEQL